MSEMSRWSYQTPITIWSVTLSDTNEPIYGTPYTVMGSYMTGGQAQRRQDGLEFIPIGTYWFEAALSDIPKEEWAIAKGTFTGSPPVGVEKIELTRVSDPFDIEDIPDVVVFT